MPSKRRPSLYMLRKVALTSASKNAALRSSNPLRLTFACALAMAGAEESTVVTVAPLPSKPAERMPLKAATLNPPV